MMKLLLILTLLMNVTYATEISITIDDPGVQSAPGMSHVQVGEKILKTLKQQNLKVVLFVCGMRVDNEEGKKLLALWDNSNHVLANHTYSHKNYNKSDYAFFKEDIEKNEQLLTGHKSFKKIFRYPMLKEGDTAQKRDQLRSFLKDKGYSFGHVTIDASDWYVSLRMVEKLNKGEKVDLAAFKKYYLAHIWDRAQYYNKLSKDVLGREVKHNLLIHHNVLNGYFLNDLIEMFKQKGWKVIDAPEAFKDPVYSLSPKIVPAGESLLWGLAKETGKFDTVLRYPGEDGEYQKAEMDQLKL